MDIGLFMGFVDDDNNKNKKYNHYIAFFPEKLNILVIPSWHTSRHT